MKKLIYFLQRITKLVVFSFLLSSCYTTEYSYVSLEDTYDSYYRNWTKIQIINKFGAPDRIVPIDSPSEILVYETYKAMATNIDGLVFSQGRRNYIEFYLDKSSRCYQVKTNAKKEVEYTVKDKQTTSILAVLGGILGIGAIVALICNL